MAADSEPRPLRTLRPCAAKPQMSIFLAARFKKPPRRYRGINAQKRFHSDVSSGGRRRDANCAGATARLFRKMGHQRSTRCREGNDDYFAHMRLQTDRRPIRRHMQGAEWRLFRSWRHPWRVDRRHVPHALFERTGPGGVLDISRDVGPRQYRPRSMGALALSRRQRTVYDAEGVKTGFDL